MANVPASTANATRLVAFGAASIGSAPSSTSLCTASTTTIASSTSNPIATVKANNVMKLSVKSKAAKAANVAITEVGMASITIKVARQLSRKKNVTKTTNTTAIIRSNRTSPMADSMNLAVSLVTTISTPLGSWSLICSISALIALVIATVLLPDCLRTSSTTPGRPFNWA